MDKNENRKKAHLIQFSFLKLLEDKLGITDDTLAVVIAVAGRTDNKGNPVDLETIKTYLRNGKALPRFFSGQNIIAAFDNYVKDHPKTDWTEGWNAERVNICKYVSIYDMAFALFDVKHNSDDFAKAMFEGIRPHFKRLDTSLARRIVKNFECFSTLTSNDMEFLISAICTTEENRAQLKKEMTDTLTSSTAIEKMIGAINNPIFSKWLNLRDNSYTSSTTIENSCASLEELITGLKFNEFTRASYPILAISKEGQLSKDIVDLFLIYKYIVNA